MPIYRVEVELGKVKEAYVRVDERWKAEEVGRWLRGEGEGEWLKEQIERLEKEK